MLGLRYNPEEGCWLSTMLCEKCYRQIDDYECAVGAIPVVNDEWEHHFDEEGWGEDLTTGAAFWAVHILHMKCLKAFLEGGYMEHHVGLPLRLFLEPGMIKIGKDGTMLVGSKEVRPEVVLAIAEILKACPGSNEELQKLLGSDDG